MKDKSDLFLSAEGLKEISKVADKSKNVSLMLLVKILQELEEIRELLVKRKHGSENVENKEIASIPTFALVEELAKREGVNATTAKPYQDIKVSVNGPAVVLVVID